MVERICPACQHGNPLENRFCGKCGSALEQQLPAVRQPSALALANAALPAPWKQVSKTVAIGIATLAAEAGLAWLKRKVEQGSAPAAAATTALVPTRPAQPASDVVTIVSQRVLEVWEGGDLTRRVVERNFWRKERE